MIKFSSDTLYSNLSELDDALFQQGQRQLERDLVDFVQTFETIPHTHDAATLFARLTTCKTKLETPSLNDTLNRLEQTIQKLRQLEPPSPKTEQTQEKREAYLKQQQERRKQIEAELLKESDQLDEFYAKKTRESIYRNLVGSQWLS